MKTEKGSSLLEVIVALALLGIISVLFLGSAANSANARVTADERTSAKILAESIIDSVKKLPYSANYTVTIPADYPGYTANITAANAYADSTDIQKLTVVITHRERNVLTLENYKVNR